ncbi:MAG: LacI family DNA-binding transcriptional regulator [Planctomycetota bacterium]
MPAPVPTDSRPSLADVAQASGTSVPTVSRVLNGRTKNFSVRADLRDRIVETASRLGYRPNINARTLRSQSTGYVAVLGLRMLARAIHDPSDSVIDLMAARLADAGLHLTTTFVHGDENAYELPPWQVDGAVVVRSTRPEDFAAVEAANLPYVSINSPAGPSGASIVVDDAGAMRQLLDHLHGLGHRRIAYATPPRDGVRHVSETDRQEAYEAWLRAAGRPTLVLDDGTPDSMMRPLERAVSAGVTAVIAYDHFMAANLVAAAAQRGIDVPGRISIAAFNDEYPTSHLWPTVTAVGHPKQQLADEATRRLLDAVRGGRRPERVCLPMTLSVRQSTGPPPADP